MLSKGRQDNACSQRQFTLPNQTLVKGIDRNGDDAGKKNLPIGRFTLATDMGMSKSFQKPCMTLERLPKSWNTLFIYPWEKQKKKWLICGGAANFKTEKGFKILPFGNSLKNKLEHLTCRIY